MTYWRFRTIRKCWMGLSTLLSLTTIALSVSFMQSIAHKSYLVVLIGIPSLAIFGSLFTTLRKTITQGRSHQRVSAELTWTFALLPFQLIIALFSTGIANGEYTPEVTKQFLTLKAIIWTNCGVVTFYIITILALSAITQFAFDADVWKRDIDASPSPFPMSIIVPYALPFTARFFSCPSQTRTTTTTTPEAGHAYCLPGCTCTRKLLPSPSPPHIPITPQLASRTSFAASTLGGSTRPLVPIRLPTEMERRHSILVAFDGLVETAA